MRTACFSAKLNGATVLLHHWTESSVNLFRICFAAQCVSYQHDLWLLYVCLCSVRLESVNEIALAHGTKHKPETLSLSLSLALSWKQNPFVALNISELKVTINGHNSNCFCFVREVGVEPATVGKVSVASSPLGNVISQRLTGLWNRPWATIV